MTISSTRERRSLRVLCISPLFAPAADSEAFCSAKLVRALTDTGTEVKVLSSESIRSKDRVFDASEMWKATERLIADVPQPTGREPLRSLSMAVRYQTAIYSRWVADAVREAARLHCARKFDLVYSRSLPMIAHVVGYWCAKIFRTPWIANINDPWEFNFVPGLAYQKTSAFGEAAYLFWLKRTLRSANLVTYPCRQLHQFHEKLAGMPHRAEIIPHIGTRSSTMIIQPFAGKTFNLVHAGKLGTSEITGRSTTALLSGLRQFFNLHPEAQPVTKLALVGQKDDQTELLIQKLGLRANVESVGRVSYEESLKHIASASVCILVEADFEEGMFFPSKLADYLAAGKPVLALSPKKGVAADLALQGGITRVDSKSANEICSAVENLYRDFAQNSLSTQAPCTNLISQFEPSVVAGKFLTAAESLLHPVQQTAMQYDELIANSIQVVQ